MTGYLHGWCRKISHAESIFLNTKSNVLKKPIYNTECKWASLSTSLKG